MNLFQSKVTWTFIAMFIVGGLEYVGILPVGAGAALLALLGIGGIAGHNRQIKAGSIR